MIKRVDIVKQHVALLRVPGFEWSYCVKTVLLIELHSRLKVIAFSQGLNFMSSDSLSALEPCDPGPMYIRKFRVLPLFCASVKHALGCLNHTLVCFTGTSCFCRQLASARAMS